MLAYVDGRLLPEEEASVSVLDAGLNFADGVFEGIRVYGGRVLHLDAHLERLFASAAAFAIDVGLDRPALRAEILRWLAANEVTDDLHFRPIVTRGRRSPPRLDPRFSSGPATVVIVGGPVTPPPSGLRVVLSPVRRPAPDVLPPHVKSLNYGPSLLARLDAQRRGADDAILLDDLGLVAEASAANLFAVLGDDLVTPRPRACLDGITRCAVIALARAAGRRVAETDLTPVTLRAAGEVFLTGTSAEVTPVVAIDGRPVGTGAPGPVTRDLARAYAALTRAEGVPIPAAV